MLAGVMAAGMSAGSVQAATTEDASGDLYVFIAASLKQMQWKRSRKILMKSIRMLIFFSMQTVQVHLQTQIEEGSRCDIFFSAATKQMDALVDEELARERLCGRSS